MDKNMGGVGTWGPVDLARFSVPDLDLAHPYRSDTDNVRKTRHV